MHTHLLPSPTSGRILLLVSPDTLAGELFVTLARLALQGPLYVLDGGYTFQGYSLARSLRRQTSDITTPMQRVLFVVARVYLLPDVGPVRKHACRAGL